MDFSSVFTPLGMIKVFASVLALMIAIIGHEIMHGYIAFRHGDSTAKDAGRLSINPIVHVDPIGTIVIPLMLFISGAPFLFGWAKPVPVDMKEVIEEGGYNAAMSVSLAGIIYNFVMAGFAAAFLLTMSQPEGYLDAFAFFFFLQLTIFNVVLGVFNLWPIPRFDGANCLIFLSMKHKWYGVIDFMRKIEPYGIFILLIILITPLNKVFFAPAYILFDLLLG